ncbi:hypothetical protein FRC09_014994, partial [Ceratobasidium sp. 395]
MCPNFTTSFTSTKSIPRLSNGVVGNILHDHTVPAFTQTGKFEYTRSPCHIRLIPTYLPKSFLFTLLYGENTHVLLEDRKSLERPATLEKIRAEQQAANQAAQAAAAAQPLPVEDDDVIIIDSAGQEPGAALPKAKQIPIPLHFRTTFISLKPPATFEQFLGQVKAKWAPRPTAAMIDGVTCAIGTDWLVRIGYIVQGTIHKGIMLE